MTKEKRALLEKTFQTFVEVGLSGENVGILDDMVAKDIVGFGTTIDEKIFGVKEMSDLLLRQKKQSAGMDMKWKINTLDIHISSDENTAIFTNEVMLYITVEGNAIEMYLRFSVVLEYAQDKWLVVHWHGSKPEHVESEKDTWGIDTWKERAEELEKQVAERTADLVVKSRELEIEAALERVRSTSLAMRTSQDLSKVVYVVFTELIKLDAQLDRCLILIVNPQTFDITWYLTGKEGLLSNNGFLVPNNQHPSHQAYLEGWRNKRKNWHYVLAGEEKRNWDDFGFSQTELSELPQFIKTDMAAVEAIHLTISSDDFGCLIASSLSSLLEEHAVIVDRFSTVFNQTYTRFLDLQKAEAQAREAEIELGLERVRARAMAMQHSGELSALVDTLFKELTKLDFALNWCIINIIDEPSLTNMVWAANPETNKPPESYLMKFEDYPFHHSMLKGYRGRKAKHEYVMEGEEKKSYDEYLFNETEWRRVPKAAQDASRAMKRYVATFTFSNFGGLQTVGEEYLSEQNLDILSRFGKVFDLTYRRFNDLQKAEAQAREAQIEVALERVRARTMAMHNSQDVDGIVTTLFDELLKLGVNRSIRSGIGILNKSRLMEVWTVSANPSGQTSLYKGVLDMGIHPLLTGVQDAWEAKRSSYSYELTGDDLKRYFNALLEAPGYFIQIDLKKLPEKILFYDFFFPDGHLFIFSPTPVSDEIAKVFMRFASVFGQTYQRFLDLQKAEAQAREAQIEAALERVRAKTMAMHKSEQLPETAQVLFEQFAELGKIPDRIAIGIIKEDSQVIEWWVTDQAGSQLARHFDASILEPPIAPYFTAWKEGKDSIMVDLSGKALKEWVAYVRDIVKMPIDDSSMRGRRVHHGAFFSQGLLLISAHEPMPDETMQLLVRFAKVFNQTYTRFLDLQKAEAQAREAQIEAALERVRASSMAMHKSDELLQVIQTLSGQLCQLGIQAEAVSFLTDGDENGYNMWLSSPGEDFLSKIFIPRIQDRTTLLYLEAKEQGKRSYSYVLSKEEKDIYFHNFFNNTVLRDYPDNGKEQVFAAPGMATTNVLLDKIILSVSNFGNISYSDDDNEIINRIANVFQQSYTRFLDLQKAEAQSREAQIELSLERIRAQVTAMQESSDLLDIVVTMRTEFVKLGHEAHYFWHMRWLPETYSKAMTSGDGTKIGMVMTLPRHIHGEIPLVADWEKTKEPTVVLAMDVDTAVDYVEKMITLGDFQQVDPQAPTLDDIRHINGLTFVMARTTHGEIGYSLPGVVPEPSNDAVDTLVRFASVFDLAYKRFEDLKSAERQNREAQIELALERVRARSMAMHKSEELADLSLELVKQVQNLGIETWFCAFNIYGDDPRGSVEWGSNGEGTFPEYLTPREGIFLRYYESGQKGETFLLNEIGEEECPAHYEYLCSLPGVGDQLLEMKDAGLPFPKSQIDHVAFFKYGYIIFITFEPVPEAHGVFKRFAQVFEQTYTRFLDLQRAEAQTREAKIEASLEKVRSRTMGMQSSEELPIVANLLFLEVQALGIPAWSCGYCILRDDRKSSTCIMSSEGTLQKPFVIPHSGEVSFDEWDDFIRGNETFFTQELAGNAIESHYGFMKSLPQLAPVFRELENAGLSLPVYQVNHLAKFTQGFLLFITYEKFPAAYDIFKRFTKVFEQTYTRFLDLKKAEEQARKAQIENSLEKVRSRSLAMQAPDELIEVAKLLREEMGALGVEELETSSIYIHDENSGTTQCWFTIKDAAAPDKAVTDQIIINLQDTRVGQMMLDFYRSEAKQTSILMQGEQRIEWIRYCEEKSDLFGSAGFYGETIPDRTYHLCKFSDGFIGAAAPGDISQESRELLQRVTAVFSFAYTRFRDLQIAEESARSSRRQASLDRVRADISSMRSTEDLDRIIPLIWNELTTLGIPFIRCGVFMVDNKRETVSVHLSSPDGTLLAAMNLAFGANELTNGVVEAWRKGQVYRQHWDKDDFLNYGKSMVAQGQVKDLKSYQGDAEAPESLYLHFIPFSQGLLYVGALQILEDDQIDLVTMLARAFAIAYARYEDFVKLEEAKTAVESTLGELKATQGQLVQQEKLASLGQLTAGIAHEIKNPLNFVNNFSEVSLELIDESLEEMNRALETRDEALLSENLAHIRLNIQKVLDHGSRANSIVNSMLMHSRGGTGRAEPTILNDFIREYSNLAYHGMRAGNHPLDVQMIFDLDESVKEVRLIAEDFSRVVLNICNNAFDAMRTTKKPALTICTLLQKDYVRIYFEDNGPGIPDEIKDKILQPFFTTKKGTEGTGLGLSISHDIVKAHGGALSVETKDGNGSIFIIQLPVL